MKKKVKPAKKAAPKKITTVKKTAKKISKPSVKKVNKPAAKPAVSAAHTAAKKPVLQAVAGEALSAQELKEIKQHLLEMRAEALARLKDKKDDMPEAEVGDPIDTATQSLDKEILFELSDNSQVLVDQIEAALRKIDKGIYGACESCRAVLPKKRIKALPFARYCVNCQHSNENRSY